MGTGRRPRPDKPYDDRFLDLIDEILERWPKARDFDPCPCGITLAVVPARVVGPPDLHFPIRDADLIRRAREAIRERAPIQSQYEGPDAVLIMAERA